MNEASVWVTRPETEEDFQAIREVNLAAFATADEADLAAPFGV